MNGPSLRGVAAMIIRLLMVYFMFMIVLHGAVEAIQGIQFLHGPWTLFMLYWGLQAVILGGGLGVCWLVLRKTDRLAAFVVPADEPFPAPSVWSEISGHRLLLVGLGLYFVYRAMPTTMLLLAHVFYQRHYMLMAQWEIELREMLPQVATGVAQLALGLTLLLARNQLARWLCQNEDRQSNDPNHEDA